MTTIGNQKEQACVAPASSGPAALVERLRETATGERAYARDETAKYVAVLLEEAADALASASPAPACASCAELQAKLAIHELRPLMVAMLCCKALDRAERAEAIQQSQAQEIARLRSALTDIASFGGGVVVGSAFDEPHSARLARAALKGQQP